MGLYHSVGIAYGFEIPNTTDLSQLDETILQATSGQPGPSADKVGHIVIGDLDRLMLCTRYLPVKENEAVPVVPDELASVAELRAWDSALHHVAVLLGHSDHLQPRWLVVHNYR